MMIEQVNVDFEEIDLSNSLCGDLIFDKNDIIIPVYASLLDKKFIPSNLQGGYLDFSFFKFSNYSSIHITDYSIKNPKEVSIINDKIDTISITQDIFLFGSDNVITSNYFEFKLWGEKFSLLLNDNFNFTKEPVYPEIRGVSKK
ncbi:hypothetical protein [Flammeovirga sp. SJP92]|uniref:hypothetical protein n=1 Tax=Flammeovirga sp. SJP92 TaxID=1775430 RepID=UPI000788CE10|nr:hypothetical protein [Flammeovirga sp. SJP92]KXX69245.1 hypothetical protein AVL50_16420 [Flammeovirga sp. SJP92]